MSAIFTMPTEPDVPDPAGHCHEGQDDDSDPAGHGHQFEDVGDEDDAHQVHVVSLRGSCEPMANKNKPT